MNKKKMHQLISALKEHPPESTLLDREKDSPLSREAPVSPFFGVAFSPYRSVGETCFQERKAFIERAIAQVAAYLDLDLETVKGLFTPERLAEKHYSVTTAECITAVERVLEGAETEEAIWSHVA